MVSNVKQWIEDNIQYIDQNDYSYVLAQMPYEIYHSLVEVLDSVGWFDPLIQMTQEKLKEVLDYIHEYEKSNDIKFKIEIRYLRDSISKRNTFCDIIIVPLFSSKKWRYIPCGFKYEVNANKVEIRKENRYGTIYPELIDVLDLVLNNNVQDKYKQIVDYYMEENNKIINRVLYGRY